MKLLKKTHGRGWLSQGIALKLLLGIGNCHGSVALVGCLVCRNQEKQYIPRVEQRSQPRHKTQNGRCQTYTSIGVSGFRSHHLSSMDDIIAHDRTRL